MFSTENAITVQTTTIGKWQPASDKEMERNKQSASCLIEYNNNNNNHSSRAGIASMRWNTKSNKTIDFLSMPIHITTGETNGRTHTVHKTTMRATNQYNEAEILL